MAHASASCRIRSDRQTTSLTLTTGVCEAGTKMRGANNINIHYDVTCLLTAVWRSHSGRIVWAAWINCELAREEEGGGGFWTHSTYTGYPGSAGSRQPDRWRWCKRGHTVWQPPPPLQKTPDMDPIKVQCWATVYAVAPALSHHWVNVSCFAGSAVSTFWNRVMFNLALSPRRQMTMHLDDGLSLYTISPDEHTNAQLPHYISR